MCRGISLESKRSRVLSTVATEKQAWGSMDLRGAPAGSLRRLRNLL